MYQFTSMIMWKIKKLKFELQNWRKDSKKIRSMKKDGENISAVV